MNKIINRFLLDGDTFMPEMDSQQPWFTYSTCELFTKKNKSTKIQRNRYIYKKEQDLTCFQYDMVYVDFKDLPRKAISEKVLQEKAFVIVSNS